MPQGMASVLTTDDSPRSGKRWAREIISALGPFVGLILLGIVLSVLSPYFLTANNLLTVGLQTAVVAIMAVGEMFVILTAGIDLSVGSIVGLSGVISTLLLLQGVNVIWSVLAGTLVGVVFGALSGFLIARGGIPPFIATLGTMGMARGFALILTGGAPTYGLPMSFSWLGGGRLFGVPVPVVLMLLIALAGHFVLSYTRFGRYTYAIGSNAEAARLSGIRVKAHLVWVYLISGLLSGFAGVVLASRMSTGQPTAGNGYELDVIAACVIGGASLMGGEGRVVGAIVGALIMGVLRNGANLLNVSAFWQQVLIGAVVIGAVYLDQRRRRGSRGIGLNS